MDTEQMDMVARPKTSGYPLVEVKRAWRTQRTRMTVCQLPFDWKTPEGWRKPRNKYWKTKMAKVLSLRPRRCWTSDGEHWQKATVVDKVWWEANHAVLTTAVARVTS